MLNAHHSPRQKYQKDKQLQHKKKKTPKTLSIRVTTTKPNCNPKQPNYISQRQTHFRKPTTSISKHPNQGKKRKQRRKIDWNSSRTEREKGGAEDLIPHRGWYGSKDAPIAWRSPSSARGLSCLQYDWGRVGGGPRKEQDSLRQRSLRRELAPAERLPWISSFPSKLRKREEEVLIALSMYGFLLRERRK